MEPVVEMAVHVSPKQLPDESQEVVQLALLQQNPPLHTELRLTASEYVATPAYVVPQVRGALYDVPHCVLDVHAEPAVKSWVHADVSVGT